VTNMAVMMTVMMVVTVPVTNMAVMMTVMMVVTVPVTNKAVIIKAHVRSKCTLCLVGEQNIRTVQSALAN